MRGRSASHSLPPTVAAAGRSRTPSEGTSKAATRAGSKATPTKTAAAAAAALPVNLVAFREAAAQLSVGDGTPAAPYLLPMGETSNAAGCLHCPVPTCDCEAFADALFDATTEARLQRVTEVAGKNFLCAKSVLPSFVTRMAAELQVTAADTFYDLGSGNGSVLFQVAFMTGARCVGVELSAHNAELSREVWALLRPKLERLRGKPMPEVEIISGDLVEVVRGPRFGRTGGNTVVWTANLLMPRAVTHYMSEVFRGLAVGARIMCFDDLYPHGRASCRTRDPEAFELFEMTDFIWPPLSVEWTSTGGGHFYRHVRV
jgi:hypothetical protein